MALHSLGYSLVPKSDLSKGPNATILEAGKQKKKLTSTSRKAGNGKLSKKVHFGMLQVLEVPHIGGTILIILYQAC